MRIAAHVCHCFYARLFGTKQFPCACESHTVYLFKDGIPGGFLEPHLRLTARTSKIIQYVSR